jgi:hypothetical protein
VVVRGSDPRFKAALSGYNDGVRVRSKVVLIGYSDGVRVRSMIEQGCAEWVQ